MAAIAALSTLGNTIFKSGVNVFDGARSGSLVARLNTIIAKINAIIVLYNAGTLDALAVAGGSGTLYTGGTGAGLTVDGINPTTLDTYRIQDQWDGAYVTVTYNSGGAPHAVANFVVA